MEPLKTEFTLEIRKKTYFERVREILIVGTCLFLFFFVSALFFGKQSTYLARIWSFLPFVLLLLVFLPFPLIRFKQFIYKIHLVADGLQFNGLDINKEVLYHMNYEELTVQVSERVTYSGKLAHYALVFSDKQKKYELNKDGEWTFSEIHEIISALENIRKIHLFSIDGFHFKKDIEERMKKD